MVAPIAVHCDGGFPVYGQAVWVKKSVRRYYLLGGDEIAVIRGRMAFGERTEAFAAAFKAVVDYYVGLEFADH